MSRPARTTHGDYGYAKKHKCPCEPCAQARSTYSKRRDYERHLGIQARLDPAPTRAIIERYMALGADRTQLAAASGVSPTVIKNILGTHGRTPAKWVLRPTAEKFAALTPEAVFSNKTFVDPTGVQRRISALRAWGHSCGDVAKAIGVSEAQVYHYLYASYVTTETRAKVDAAYQLLRQEPGNCQRTLWAARRRNQPIPMCWDDETIDDPSASPAPRRCLIGPCGRPATRASLCRSHAEDAAKRGVFAKGAYPSRYREVVVLLSRRAVVDRNAARDSVAECFAQGMSVDNTAFHLGVSRDFIYKVRKEIRDGAAR